MLLVIAMAGLGSALAPRAAAGNSAQAGYMSFAAPGRPQPVAGLRVRTDTTAVAALAARKSRRAARAKARRRAEAAQDARQAAAAAAAAAQAAQAQQAAAAASPPASAPPSGQQGGTVSTSGMAAFEQCVINNESGGNPGAVNPGSGAGGLFQFLPSTWAGLGYPGLPQDAPVSEQEAAFAKLYAEAGTSPWAGDGCA